ncbi:hypothetical protein [Streptomyces sp. V3I7]|uniref:hypothetical protein n=1 Tax=Streptomyces sp. V3I7 TaxID=3042278 RepID=UPI00277F73AD|nr:hypothetical protein [Streptomyces sp. V3I7]MDQ0993396.1 hypothetical protein [Streptomyces sp. V3I7]
MTELPDLALGETAAAPSPARGLGGRLFGGVLLLLALGICGGGVSMMLSAAGVQSVQGTLTVERCWMQDRTGQPLDDSRCSGTFRPDGGGEAVENAEYRGGQATEIAVGEKLRVHQSGSTYELSGGKGIARGVLMVFGGVAFSALAVPFLATGIQPLGLAGTRERARALMLASSEIKGTTAGRVRKVLFLVGLGGMLVSYFVSATLS